jgi:hypothetical protein
VEVEQVTHIFSSETGFITVITPDLVVQCNEIASMSLVDSLATYFGSVWLGYQKKQFGSGQIGSLELGDLPWTGVPGRESFYPNDPNNLPLPPITLLWTSRPYYVTARDF